MTTLEHGYLIFEWIRIVCCSSCWPVQLGRNTSNSIAELEVNDFMVLRCPLTLRCLFIHVLIVIVCTLAVARVRSVCLDKLGLAFFIDHDSSPRTASGCREANVSIALGVQYMAVNIWVYQIVCFCRPKQCDLHLKHRPFHVINVDGQSARFGVCNRRWITMVRGGFSVCGTSSSRIVLTVNLRWNRCVVADTSGLLVCKVP